jgi:ATPase subunit of ABC transporter with duplicated ATPase domains
MLIKALSDFDGSMLFVSHDRSFLRGLSNRVLDLQPEGDADGPNLYAGGYVEWVRATGQDAPGVHR